MRSRALVCKSVDLGGTEVRAAHRVWNLSGLCSCLYGVCGADRLKTLICRSAVPTTYRRGIMRPSQHVQE